MLTGHESIKLNGANNVTRGLCTQRTHLTAIGRPVQGLLGTENDGTSNIKTFNIEQNCIKTLDWFGKSELVLNKITL